jgi:hypothetical protein
LPLACLFIGNEEVIGGFEVMEGGVGEKKVSGV